MTQRRFDERSQARRDAVARPSMTSVPAHAHSSMTRRASASGTRRATRPPSRMPPAVHAPSIAFQFNAASAAFLPVEEREELVEMIAEGFER